jgi:hypothetical protein
MAIVPCVLGDSFAIMQQEYCAYEKNIAILNTISTNQVRKRYWNNPQLSQKHVYMEQEKK